jgi:hypothetical protein
MYRSVLLMLGIGICAVALGSDDDLFRDQWRMSGQDAANSRNQPAEMLISPRNVHSLTTKWVFTTGGDVSATPTVFGESVFFPDSAGNLFAVNKRTGQLIWSHQIPSPSIIAAPFAAAWWHSMPTPAGSTGRRMSCRITAATPGATAVARFGSPPSGRGRPGPGFSTDRHSNGRCQTQGDGGGRGGFVDCKV